MILKRINPRYPWRCNRFYETILQIFKDARSVADYLSSVEWETGRRFIYHVLQGEKFTSDLHQSYESSWPCTNQLLIDKGDNIMDSTFQAL